MFEMSLSKSISSILVIILIYTVTTQPVLAEYQTETIVNDLKAPWSVVFTPDDRIIISERGGNLIIIDQSRTSIIKIPVLGFPFTSEGGLLGITSSPTFQQNNYIYIYMTYQEIFDIKNKVTRYTLINNTISDEQTIIDDIPGSAVHNGGRIKFGPDGKLYITTGDAQKPQLSQDINSLAGKILRINPDGTIPQDNPFTNSPVYSYGHRNPQGLDWNQNGTLLITEHGPSGEFGKRAHDEINVIHAGQDYGWPSIFTDEFDDTIRPVLDTKDETWAPSGAVFYTSENIESLSGKFIVATLYGKHLRVIDVDTSGVVKSSIPILNEFGRLRDATIGPDGDLYILTSNRDSRGTPQEGDDKLLRITQGVELDKCRGDRIQMLRLGGEEVCVFLLHVQVLENRGWMLKYIT